jgi:CBS domain-containing protein
MTVRETSLPGVRVRDAMHAEIITVDSSTPLRMVARLMADHRVHAIAVDDLGSYRGPWGIVSALDVVAGAASDVEQTAGEAAATEVVTVSSDASLAHAAQLMATHELSHLIVVDAANGHPVGIVSTLDVAAVYGA